MWYGIGGRDGRSNSELLHILCGGCLGDRMVSIKDEILTTAAGTATATATLAATTCTASPSLES